VERQKSLYTFTKLKKSGRRYATMAVKLLNKTHPDHGGRRHPTAAMVPCPRRRHTQQLTNMMRDKSMSFKLDNIIVLTIY
jgi:hypothetical protein